MKMFRDRKRGIVLPSFWKVVFIILGLACIIAAFGFWYEFRPVLGLFVFLGGCLVMSIAEDMK